MALVINIANTETPALKVKGLPEGLSPSKANPVRITFPSGATLVMADHFLAWLPHQKEASDQQGFAMLVAKCEESVAAGKGAISTSKFEVVAIRSLRAKVVPQVSEFDAL